MRRPFGSLLRALLVAVLGLTMLAAPALADEVAADEAVILAVEAEDEPVGPNPAPRDAEENQARILGGYEDQETPFTWGAAWILAVAGGLGLVLMLLFYEFRVRRPKLKQASTS